MLINISLLELTTSGYSLILFWLSRIGFAAAFLMSRPGKRYFRRERPVSEGLGEAADESRALLPGQNKKPSGRVCAL
jgi:hypothetical protein